MKTLVTASVKKAADFIKKGEISAFPTETVYGLGANAVSYTHLTLPTTPYV